MGDEVTRAAIEQYAARIAERAAENEARRRLMWEAAGWLTDLRLPYMSTSDYDRLVREKTEDLIKRLQIGKNNE